MRQANGSKASDQRAAVPSHKLQRRRSNPQLRYLPEPLEPRTLLTASVFFSAQPSVPVGASPQSAVVADFNGDGKPDLAVDNYTDHTVSVMLGNGDGTYQAQHTFSTGSQPSGMVAADINNDGHADLIFANGNEASIGVLLGIGDGTFHSLVTYAAGVNPSGVALGDLNGDGNLDVAVANVGSDNVSILLGNGDGGFSSPASVPGPTETSSVALADVNGDGKLDIVDVGFGSNFVQVNLGAGNGTFGAATFTSIAGQGGSIAVGDINGDGHPDAVVSLLGQTKINVLLGNGTATFATPQPYDIGAVFVGVSVADMNGDGVPDVVATTQTNRVAVYTGNTNGTLNAPQQFNTGASPAAIAIADVNGDGSPDLLVPDDSANDVTVLLNDPAPALISLNRTTPSNAATQSNRLVYTARFDQPVSGVSPADFTLTTTGTITSSPLVLSPASGPSSSYTITIANIAGNGTVSVSLDQTASHIVNGDGEALKGFVGFSASQYRTTDTSDIAVADMNGDGKPDVITAGRSGNVSVLLGNGDTTLQASHDINLGNAAPVAVAVGDLNGDGKPDAVVAEELGNKVAVMLGNGDGTLQLPTEFDCGTDATPEDIAIADMNRDGIPDIIVANFGTNNVGVFLGIGNGSFNTEQTFATGIAPNSVAVADVDGDGYPDVVVANSGDQTLGYLPSNADGSNVVLLGTQIAIPTGGDVANAVIADANGDGKLDLVTYNDGALSAEVFAGDGRGHFGAGISSPISHFANKFTLADVNGDGIPDFLGAGIGAITVALGNGDGTFQDAQTLDPTGNPSASTLTLADMNRDGLPDIVADNGNATVGVEQNTPGTVFTGESYNVLKRDITIAVTGTEARFDGNAHPATFTALSVNGEDASSFVTLSYTDTANGVSGTTPPTSVGTYKVFASLTGTNSFNAISTFDTGKTVVISPLSSLQSIPSGKLPTAGLIAGQKIKPIKVNVKVTNNSDVAITGLVTVRVALSTSASGAPEDPVVATIKKIVKLKAHQTASFGSAVISSLPAGLSGTQHLLFKLTDASGAENLASAGTLSVGPAFNDLVALSVAAPSHVSRGKKAAATVGLQQLGNVPLTGTLPAELFLSTTSTIDAGSIDLGTTGARVSLQPGKKNIAHLIATIPASVTPGTYFLIARLDPANTRNDKDLTNNTATSRPFNVS